MRIAVLLAFLFAMAGVANAAPAGSDVADWSTKAAVNLPAAPDRGIVELPLGDEVFDKARPDLSDLRILDGDGVETGYVLRSAEGVRTLDPVEGRVLNEEYVPKQQSSCVVDFGANVAKNRIEVTTEGDGFWRTATIEAGNDGIVWHTLVQGAILVRKPADATGALYEKKAIAFPENDRRYLRVTVFNGPGDPDHVAIISVKSFRYVVTAAETVAVTVAAQTVTQDAERHRTEITLDLGRRNLPLAELKLNFTDANFFRRVSLSGRNTERETIRTSREDAAAVERVVDTPWQPIMGSPVTGGAVYRYSAGGKTDESTTIGLSRLSLSGPGYRYLRIWIENASDPPLDVQGASVTRLAYYLDFQARPGKTYALYFGNPRAPSPTYDFAQYAGRLRKDGVTKASLEAAVQNPAKRAGRVPPWSERHKGLIWAALVLVIIVLGLLIMRQLKTAPQPPGGPSESNSAP